MINYNYEWKTLDEIIKNKKTKVCFRGYSETSLDEITDGASNKDYKIAHELWLKLKEAFNKEILRSENNFLDDLSQRIKRHINLSE